MLKTYCLLSLFIFMMVQGGLAQVQVTVPDTTANGGTEIAIPVRVSNCSNYDIYSYQLTMTYNSAVLTPVRLETTNTVVSNWPAPVMNDSTIGVLEIGGYGSNKIVGGGSLIRIVFQVIGNPNQVSNLNISYFEFNDGSPGATIDNGSLTVIMSALAVTITTNAPGNTKVIVDGTSYTAPHVSYWEAGTQHEISVASVQTLGTDRRYVFQSWSDGGAQTHTITVTAPTTITATCATQYYLTVQSSFGAPQGSGWYDAGMTAYFSVESEIMSDASTKRLFASWSGSGSGSYSGTVRETSVTMNAPIIETANWTTSFQVQITSAHGAPYGAGWYNAGTVVNFGIDSTQINRWNAHYQFNAWAGSGTGSYSGTSPQSTITVNSPITEVAQWNEEFLVQTGSSPQGVLTVPGAGWYPGGYPFTTMTAPVSISKDGKVYQFKGWIVNDQVVAGNPITQSVTLPLTIIADYNQDITVIITTSVGEGTKVLVDGEEKEAPHTASWTSGSTHSIGVASVQNGVPGTRHSYVQWQHGGSQAQTVNPSANINYVANLKTEYFLDLATDPANILTLTGEGWYEANDIAELDSIAGSFKSGQSSYRFLHWLEDGNVRAENPITIVMNAPHTAVAKFQSGYFISGTITFVGASPAPVTMNITGTENFTMKTNAGGAYLIGGLLAGNYQITLVHPNFRFEPTTRSYQISKNEEYQYYVAFYVSAVAGDDRFTGTVPDHFYLGQNYPNPFSDLTQIDYHLKNVEHVVISIYNIRGQLVNRLIDQQQPGGLYRICWDRTDFRGMLVPAGMYYYRIDAGSYSDKKSMIIF